MPLHRPTLKTLYYSAGAILAVYALYLLFGWLALPRIIQHQSQSVIAEKSGHRLTMDLPDFNPFTLALRIPKLRLETPEGKPLLALDEFFVDVSASSLFRRAYVFDAIRIAAPQVDVALMKDGTLNWTPLIEAMKSKEPQPTTALPRLDVQRFTLTAGRVDFADEKADFSTRIDPVDFELDDVSTVTDEEGRYRLDARTNVGAQLSWQGRIDLTPVAAVGHIAVTELDLAKLAPYLKQALPGVPAGVAAIETEYRASYADGKIDLEFTGAKANVKGLRVPTGRGPWLNVATLDANDARFDLASGRVSLAKLAATNATLDWPRGKGPAAQKLGDLSVEDVRADLNGRTASVARVALTGGQIKAARSAEGRIDLADAFAPAPAAAPAKKSAPSGEAKPWHFTVGAAEVAGTSATLRDESVRPAADIALTDIRVVAEKISDDLKAPVAVQASLRAQGGGTFKATGQLVPAAPSADLKFELADLAIKPAEPYLAAVAKLAIVDGKVSLDGRVNYGQQGPAFKGGFAVRDLRLDEAGTKSRFLIWKSLASRNVEASPARVDVRDLALDGLDASLLIAKDKTVNLSRILRSDQEKKTAAAEPAAKTKPAFVANIYRLRVTKSEMDFADQSLALPFATRIHHLRGTVTDLSTRPGAAGLLELEGQVDDYGLARAAGRIELFNPTDFADVNVVFRNVEMTRLTPYSATFLGRKITSGKLSLDLQYKFDKRRVQGENRVVMDRLTLGERVESPEAKDLPLDLAIAVLEDSQGRIDLGLPVSGSLDDPQFSYGSVVWKALVNVITKVATAPFRALASIFGGGEKLDMVAFEAGSPRLTPPEREKLVRIAGILGKRPGLALTVHGVWSDADRVAIQDRQLRRAIAQKTGQKLEANEDPGPLSTQDPKIQSAIEDLFADRFGRAELAGMKDGFRKANPGQLPESTTGKVMSRLTNLLREPRALSESEVSQLKGADFYGVLFDRLRAKENVPDDQLQTLAQSRGVSAADALKAAGAPLDRVTLGASEKVEAPAKEVPLKLDAGKAK